MWDNYKFRCHSISNIMTKPKKDIVSDGAKTFLYKIYDQEVNGVSEILSTKEMRKGIMCEQDTIDLLNEVHGSAMEKNSQRFSNDYLHGEPDILNPVLVDVKTSWDLKTFRNAELSVAYKWQLKAYAWLLKRTEGYLAYGLVDTPVEFIEDAKRTLMWQLGILDDSHPDFMEAANQLEMNMTFSHIAPKKRLKIFHVPFYDDDSLFFIERVEAAREFLKRIEREDNEGYGIIPLDVPKKSLSPVDKEIDVLAAIIAHVFGIMVDEIKSNSRKQEIMLARHMWRASCVTLFSSALKAAKHIKVDKVTMYNSIKQHKQLLDYDKTYKERHDQATHLYDSHTTDAGLGDGK